MLCRQHGRMKLVQRFSGPWKKDSRPAWAHWIKFKNPKILRRALKKHTSRAALPTPDNRKSLKPKFQATYSPVYIFVSLTVLQRPCANGVGPVYGATGRCGSRRARKKLGHWGVALEGDLGTLVCLSIPVSGHHGIKQLCPTLQHPASL